MVCARSGPVNDKTSFRHKKIFYQGAKAGWLISKSANG